MSRIDHAAVVAARAVFACYWLLTAAYCVIAFVPFTYVEVIQFAVVPPLNTFARLHPYLYWIALGSVAFTMREDLRRPAMRRWVVVFLSVSAAAGVALGIRPVLTALSNDVTSLRFAFASLVPLCCVAIIDLAGHAGRLSFSPSLAEDDGRLFRASWMTAVFLTVVYLGGSLVRFAGGGTIAALFSLASHLVVFMGIFAVVSLIRALAAVCPSPGRAELALVSMVAAAALSAVLIHLVLGSISLSGRPSIAISVAAAIIASHVGFAVRLADEEGASADSGVGVFLAPLAPGRGASRAARAALLLALALAATVLASATSVMDWNFLLQKLTALAIWVLAFAGFHALPRSAGRRPWPVEGHLAIAVLALCAFLAQNGVAGARASRSLDLYAGHDPSFKVARDLLTKPQRGASRDDSAFYRFLQEHTNIPRSTHIEPFDLRLVASVGSTPGNKPNVFILVVDSLRPDYLSPYNAAVTFTPAIGDFARDSIVFTNAFTRYGGSGLSEPSIWVGGMIPHQQYMAPFHPLNSLEKLLTANGYRSFVSLDTILRVILAPDPSSIELDRGVQTRDLRVGRSLTDLAARLRAGEANGRPVFAYAQPQDLHISTIAREKASVPAGESYPGFYAPYASRLRRADAAFGEFVVALRELNLYDDSIIVLTSDHGDSLGEDGRWGHAYTIYPEVLRVPLIVHLPPAMRARVVADPDALAFVTDITPTLCALLDQEPVLRNGIFGRPLFATHRRQLPSAERADGKFLAVSSYGPVYGILGGNGRSLYIADAVSYTESLYDLTTYPATPPAALSDAQRASYRQLVRDALDDLHAFYGVR